MVRVKEEMEIIINTKSLFQNLCLWLLNILESNIFMRTVQIQIEILEKSKLDEEETFESS